MFHYKKTGEEGVLYEIWKADYTNIDCVHLYERVQIFNIMYIDAASTIDSTDEKWLGMLTPKLTLQPSLLLFGCLQSLSVVFFVYRREEKSASSSSGYKLVGFSSVYPFWIPLDSLRHRISQFLILPEYQGSGHGGMNSEHHLSCLFQQIVSVDLTLVSNVSQSLSKSTHSLSMTKKIVSNHSYRYSLSSFTQVDH